MNWEKVVTLFVIIAFVISVAFLAVNPLKENMKLGLDLRGGVQVRLEANDTETHTVTEDDIDQVIAIMRNRVDSLGVTEPVIQKEGQNRILIELPGIQDPEAALDIIGKTAKLEFRTLDGTVILEGKDLSSAKEGINQTNQEYIVSLDFKTEGALRFAEVTQNLVNDYPDRPDLYPETNGRDPRRHIAIFLDEDILQNPYVSTAITGGSAMITGYENLQEARTIALLLNSGALPVKVEMIEKRTVGPTLGADSIAKSLQAGLWGLIAIMLFMAIYYRIPGLVAIISLVLYSVLVLTILTLLNATLTLPGIAGFLLSIGMCVDANIIIYERLKEELRNGKTLRAAVDSGFKRAFVTIFDSNVTTLIAAAVLFFLGSGTVKGFAVTLGIGILMSMFTAITFTRFLMRTLVESKLVTKTKLYGA